jgi:hypothetical protein
MKRTLDTFAGTGREGLKSHKSTYDGAAVAAVATVAMRAAFILYSKFNTDGIM